MRRVGGWLSGLPVLLGLVLSCGKGGSDGGAAGTVQVVTSITVLEDFVRAVGGDQVEVRSLITGLENPHTYEPRARDVQAVARAELFVKIGLGLEAWAEKVMENAGSSRLRVLEVSQGIEVLERGAEGEHGGNPHIWMDPRNAKGMIGAIRDALEELRPKKAAYFRSRYAAYVSQLDDLMREMGERFCGLRGRRVVTYAPAFPYLLRWLQIVEAERIMTVPGMEPSARRVTEVVDRMKAEGIRVILTMPQYSGKVPEMVASETGAQVVRITPLLGGLPGTETYLGMIRYDAERIAEGLEGVGSRE